MSGFPPDLFAGRRYAVLGLGRNGLPAAQALHAMGADVVAWDDKNPVADGIALRDPLPEIASFDALMLSPGIPHALPRAHPTAAAAITAGVPVLSDADLLFQAVRKAGSAARFAGITGTNGKSTTTTLLAHMLARAGVPVAAGGNLGPAALALPLLPDNGVYVLEMSSYMLERIHALRFSAAAMLNLSPDHLDRHGDMAGYRRAKEAIFHRQDANDLAVIGTDDADSAAFPTGAARVARISGEHPADLWAEGRTVRDARGAIAPLPPSLPGAHNGQNAAAAAAMARHLGLTDAQIADGIASFPGLAHRQQRVAEIGGVPFINDSKATNADAAARALGCYDRIVWIAGGQAKAGGIESLRPYFPRIVDALLIGQDAPLLADTLGATPHRIVHTLEAAVAAAFQTARAQNAVVLLSPACASFDQFASFEARGNRFAELVSQLCQEDAA